MTDCIDRGLSRESELPGGLHIPRRAKKLHDKLLEDQKKITTIHFGQMIGFLYMLGG
ncbi:hypothetical protein X471_00445 [Bartonella bacilliformis str. Heidi Mejia]|uniref:hypothetical protein n=1 Tax=Bartonella bacilliformis TaxID=774 RepID=UPI00044AE9D7|nr:hypothetical protein [Bartonella bacilliformis]EYS92153.1 hypothetical protein X471_00445 [Bartonella bacilliformis str. Heidi Mejia]KEG18776.1 hypothetical protein H707_00504 [Bartonella bacilliformis Hosp800-02]KEG23884.1 hypothetical protein H708_00511 [Bartonella bacilliformis VAB9028]KEG24233.1 hypothetical protein H706_00514 [Bartonella bacilliformis CAR600-02]